MQLARPSEQIGVGLAVKIAIVSRKEMTMAVVGSGVLGPGGAQYLDVALRAGITYNIYVDPSEPSVDFNLFVYDENNNQVAYDNTPASSALCSVTPRWTGPFRIMVTSARGLSNYNLRVEA